MNKQSNYYAILMAGGVGSRFWPVSTTNFPKQFHDMLGTGQTLIQQTFQRFAAIIPTKNIFVLTNDCYIDLVLDQLPLIDRDQVIAEPVMRNTAPCIAYASLKIQKKNPNAVMVVAPTDHWICDLQTFQDDTLNCLSYASQEQVLITMGVKPTFANTGYGYIQYNKHLELSNKDIYAVKKFTEKPSLELAQSFLDQGNFVWNAGIFIWSVQEILKAFQDYYPSIYHLFNNGYDFLNTADETIFCKENYALADSISIDYAVLEPSDNVVVLPISFDWNDLGTWGALYEELEKDKHNNAVVNAKLVDYNSTGNMLYTHNDKKVIVVDGLSDYIIVDQPDALLIYPKSKEQSIKTVVSDVSDTYGEDYK